MNKHNTGLARVMMKNPAWGMSMMLNQPLVRKAGTVPAEDTMHDSWVTRVASLVGRIGYIDEPLVDYRVHQSNVSTVAAPRSWLGRVTSRLKDGVGHALHVKRCEYINMFEEAAQVAHVLLTRFDREVKADQRDLLQAIRSLPAQPAGKRVNTIRHYQLFGDTGVRKWLETYLFSAPERSGNVAIASQ